MSSAKLVEFFAARREDPDGLVLASVYATLGSTYSKTGAHMLITGGGDFQGMLSGGCLEGDLAERARRVVDSGEVQTVIYDLRSSQDELWGLGVGCEGVMKIALQPLAAGNDFSPFPAMIEIWQGEEPGILATVIESDDAATTAGAALCGTGSSLQNLGVGKGWHGPIADAAQDVLVRGVSQTRTLEVDGKALQVLCCVLRPPPRILVLGGGLDAEPVVKLCAELGWRVTVQDHRPAYVERGDFGAAEAVLCVPAADLASNIDLGRYDAAIAMSHHLDTDRVYLATLADSAIKYIGLLGPHDRRNRLLAELSGQKDALENRLHGPAGLDIGGRGPASIALAIVAEIHQVLYEGGVDR